MSPSFCVPSFHSFLHSSNLLSIKCLLKARQCNEGIRGKEGDSPCLHEAYLSGRKETKEMSTVLNFCCGENKQVKDRESLVCRELPVLWLDWSGLRSLKR